MRCGFFFSFYYTVVRLLCIAGNDRLFETTSLIIPAMDIQSFRSAELVRDKRKTTANLLDMADGTHITRIGDYTSINWSFSFELIHYKRLLSFINISVCVIIWYGDEITSSAVTIKTITWCCQLTNHISLHKFVLLFRIYFNCSRLFAINWINVLIMHVLLH